MLNFREITLADRATLGQKLRNLQPEISDLNFTNFFMWQHTYVLRICYLEDLDYWVLFARPKRWKPFFFVPIGDWQDEDKLKSVLKYIEDFCQNENLQVFFKRVPESFKNILMRIDPDLSAREDRNTFDYLYSVSELISLAGRKYHSKRNHLNQFLRKYKWEYQVINEEVLAEIMALETDWFNLKLAQQPKISAEDQAMLMVMTNFQQLDVVGGVIRVDGTIQAISVGEILNDNTALIHIEKANTMFSGIYAAINQQFLLNQWQDKEYVNREEDMGLEGLRKAKMSYNPLMLVKKFNLYK
ncbi:MAG TPA: phosphatidylglycerol lysyltransferase domain-containing protein [Bacillota bacterium]|jgi:hypothetical protein|nr:phosphatidylglycerol lysyltransferase domain-containing protein [Bacillota bacterium]HOL09809.1 phosphatidylglycerol lysyltransferase domain-containing protein [Bacillota bacterium]HPO97355.1 phosphatidylglycerol lysyltransferase domain-containing protein [Bacillota bacterium]